MSTMDPWDESFTVEQVAEYSAFFEAHGFVVVRGVMSEPEIEASIDELWESPMLLSRNEDCKRDDPLSWDENWPIMNNKGFVGSHWESSLEMCWRNRQIDAVYRIFANLLKEERLWVNVDRFGVMRPTKDIVCKDGTTIQRDEWKTAKSWLHWDQNPWLEPEFCRVQGLLTFTDHTATSGGFECVPDAHKEFKSWGQTTDAALVKESRHALVPVPVDDPLQQRVRKILAPKGSILIWDSRIPHQNYPNEGSGFRMVQYVTYGAWSEADFEERRTKLQTNIAARGADAAFPRVLTPLGRKLAGLVKWGDADDAPMDTGILHDMNDIEALAMVQLAEALEAQGDAKEAMETYRAAFKKSRKVAEMFNS